MFQTATFLYRLTMLTIIGLFCLAPQAMAQDLDHIQGDLLVQLKPGTDGDAWVKSWNSIQPNSLQIDKATIASRLADMWLLQFDYTQVDERSLLGAVRQAPKVLLAQFNHTVQMRGVPSDLLFDQQWQYQNTGQSGGTVDADIDAVEAWDVTTGGTTLTGDTIVVAVLDNGVDRNHPDLQRNRWFNHAEIPNNDEDDDNNGYTDDYEGWSTVSNDGNIAGGNHGTAVSGIIGADGDNELGVTGVNWYVKVMHIRNNFITNEAKVLEAYSYAWEHRRTYNMTGGAEGAFVVATNASWGVDEGNPEDFPLWCELYDLMGADGIMNCGATVNENFNVDEVGDMPTACPSDYLIAVTNTNHNDLKVPAAGFGATTIDLGAPGEDAYTTANGSGYGGFGGTSGATPHVAGTVALLYSMDCPTLVELTQADPGAAALLVKQAILESVDPIPALAGITVTGGRLNVNNAVQYMLEICDGCIPATSVQVNDITVNAAAITWNTNDSLQSVDIRWRAVGELDWNLSEDVSSPFQLTNLDGCQEYEYQLQSNCASETIAFGNSRFFQTDGCCTAPENVVVDIVSGNEVNFSWDAVTAAVSYDLRYRINGIPDWTTINTATNSLNLNSLESCTIYQYQLRTICEGETTAWTGIGSFLTDGCGPCLDLEYCEPEDVLDSSEEFIAQVDIGGFFSNSSMADPDGYADFGPSVEAFDLEAGLTYPILLTPGFTGGALTEDWRIWLDTDHNGSFTSNEIIFDTESSTAPVDGFITIPVTANLGVTRMRIVMRFSLATEACPFQGGFGEIEDYCVNIIPASECPVPDDFALTPLSFTEVGISWEPVPQALDFEADFRATDDVQWTSAMVTESTVTLGGLDSCADYTLRVRSLCNGETSDYAFYEFDTCDGPNNTTNIAERRNDWRIAPNPMESYFDIHLEGEIQTEELEVVIHDALGRVILQREWPSGQTSYRINEAAQWPNGLYTVSILQNGQLWSSRRVVK